MAVFRINKTRDYTVMSNHHLRNTSLSLKAKGLLSLMLSLPDNWDYTTKGLASICKDGIKTDNHQRFYGYCDYVIGLKEQRGVKHSTIVRYKELTTRIYPAIGHIKLCDLRVDHLNDLYTALSADGLNKKTGGKLSTKTIIEHYRLISTVLYFNGVDSVSISKRLGHAQVSTTANIYPHIIEEADQRNADILSDIFLKKHSFLYRVELLLNYCYI